jgi:signal transduction histidine kinase
VVVDGHSRPLRAVVRDEVYRVAREAVVNAYQHADAQNIEVELEYGPRELRVIVRDDGRGIGPDVLHVGREGHWGLVGMRERAQTIGAHLTVRSREQRGREVELIVPNAIGFERSHEASNL